MFEFFWWISVSGISALSSKTTSWSKIVFKVGWRRAGQARQGPYKDGQGPYKDGQGPYKDGQSSYKAGQSPYKDGQGPYKDGPCREKVA